MGSFFVLYGGSAIIAFVMAILVWRSTHTNSTIVIGDIIWLACWSILPCINTIVAVLYTGIYICTCMIDPGLEKFRCYVLRTQWPNYYDVNTRRPPDTLLGVLKEVADGVLSTPVWPKDR